MTDTANLSKRGWKECKLGDVAEINNGYSFKSGEYHSFQPGYLEVLKMGHIALGGGLRRSPKQDYMPREPKLQKYILKKNDIVLAMTDMKDSMNILGHPAIIELDDHYVLNQRVAKISVNDFQKVDSQFLYYQIRSRDFIAELQSRAHGGVQVNLTTEAIKDSVILLPLIDEQRAIAAVLSSLDDKIDLLHRQNKTLESLAETLWRKMFIEDADSKWPVDTLGNLFDIGIGRTPPRKEQHWFTTVPGHVKWVSIKDMGNCGVYIDTVSEYLTKEAVEEFNIPIIPSNTVLLSFKMTVGRVVITTEEMISNEAIAHFKIKMQYCLTSEYLYFFLNTFKYECLGSTSSIVEAINSQMIKGIEMSVPPNAAMGLFQDSVVPYFSKIRNNQSQIRILSHLRDTLLPKLMSGEVKTLS